MVTRNLLLLLCGLLTGCGASDERAQQSALPDAQASAGATYYVAPAGNDSRTCAQAQQAGMPKRTVISGINCLAGGDTLVLDDGTYVESIDDVIPSGTSWESATVIRAKNRRMAIIRPSVVGLFGFNLLDSDTHHIVIKDLVIDMINSTVQCVRLLNDGILANGFPHHIRLDGIECKNTLGSAITWNSNSQIAADLQGRENELSNCWLHLNGRRRDVLDNVVYWNARDSVVRNCEIDHNGATGIALYTSAGGTPTGAVIENNVIHDNAFYAIQAAVTGQAMIRNNIIYGHPHTFAVELGSQSVGSVQDIQFFHNTIVDNGGLCLFGNHPSNAGITIRNNICVGNRSNTIAITGATQSNNLEGGNLTFLDGPNHNYRLIAASTSAVDAGTDLFGAVPSDADGVRRFQGAAPDLGAYEFVPGP